MTPLQYDRGFYAERYGITDLKSPPIPTRAGFPNAYHINDFLGKQEHVLPAVFNALGRKSFFPPALLTNTLMVPPIRTKSKIVLSRKGPELHYNGRVVSMITPTGGPYPEVQVKVTGPEESNVEYYNRFEVFQFPGRQFIATAVSRDPADGYQILTLRPTDGVVDILVSATGNAQRWFRTNNSFSSLGVQAISDNQAYEQRFHHLGVHARFGFIEKFVAIQRDARIMANQVGKSAYTLFSIAGDSSHGDKDNLILAYITQQEAREIMVAFQKMGMALFYQDPILNRTVSSDPGTDIQPGAGLESYVLPERRLRSDTNAFTLKRLDQMLERAVVNNQFSGDNYLLLNGDQAHRQLMAAFRQDGIQIHYNHDLPQTFEGTPRAMKAGAYVDGYVDAFGYRIVFKRVPWFSSTATHPLNSPTLPDVSIRSYDSWLLDVSPMRNYASDNTGSVVDAGGHKIQEMQFENPAGQVENYMDTTVPGRFDAAGSHRQGDVVSQSSVTTRQIRMRSGLAVQDPYALTHSSLLYN